MNFLLEPTPLSAAVEKFGSRSVVASAMRTKEWLENMPLAARERAFFSAGITHAGALESAQAKLADAISMRREQVAKGTAFVDRSSFIGDMRKIAIAEGLGKGNRPKDLTDFASRARLGLIFDMQTQFATGFTRWQTDQDPDLLDEFPAQELLPSTARVPRDTWERRWVTAGGQVVDGRIVGLKNDPAWERLSIFGLPYPPFDFGSQRDLMDLDRREAEALGLIEPNQKLTPSTRRFNSKLQQSVRNLDPRTSELL
jgi:hypothetical protein